MSLLIAIFSLFAQEKPLTPPGTIEIGENFYVDQIEISNINWLEYQHFTSEDTINDKGAVAVISNRGLDPKYNEFPKVNLSYQEALNYCKWRTDFLNQSLYTVYYKDVKVNFRLPTESEMRKVLAYEEEAFKKRANRIADKIAKRENAEDLFGLIPNGKRVRGQLKGLRKNRIYSLFHNATEMSSVEGVAYGMTNETFNPSGDLMPKVVYSGPSPNVGFRCVAEFIYEQDQED